MSLINDALKRAKQAQPQVSKTADGPAFRPVEHQRRCEQTDFLMGSLVAVILLLAGLLLWVWSHGDSNVVKVRARAYNPAAKIANKNATNAPVAEREAFKPIFPMPIPVPHKAVPVVDTIAAAVTPVAEKVSIPATTPFNFKLQSIFYRPKNPSAAVNGITLYVGDVIGGARVVAIEKDYVSLTLASGENKILDLP